MMVLFESVLRLVKRVQTWFDGVKRKDVMEAMDTVLKEYDGTLVSSWTSNLHVVRNKSAFNVNNDQPVYVCLHGTGSSSVSFFPFLETLEQRGIPGIAIDLPGYGISKDFQDTRYVDECTLKIHTALGELGMSEHRIIWVGHSLGAVVAAWAAMRNPQTAFRVCMLSPPGIYPFRWRFWPWLIRNGIPEYWLTTRWVSWIGWPLAWALRKYPVYAYKWLFWCNQDRANSYAFLASCLDKKKKEWVHPYLRVLAENLGLRTHIYWSRTDPILASPFSVCVQDVADPWYPSISHTIVAGVGHSPIEDPVCVECLIGLRPHN